jgi:hypothetical protein
MELDFYQIAAVRFSSREPGKAFRFSLSIQEEKNLIALGAQGSLWGDDRRFGKKQLIPVGIRSISHSLPPGTNRVNDRWRSAIVRAFT